MHEEGEMGIARGAEQWAPLLGEFAQNDLALIHLAATRASTARCALYAHDPVKLKACSQSVTGAVTRSFTARLPPLTSAGPARRYAAVPQRRVRRPHVATGSPVA